MNLIKQVWFDALIDELQHGIGQLVKEYREAYMKVSWWAGNRIREDVEKFKEAGIEEEHVATIVAKELNKSRSWVYHSINLSKRFPVFEKIYELPEGENISLHKLIKDHLYEKRSETKEEERCKNCPLHCEK